MGAAVAWDATPTGASADEAIVLSGSMTAAGYVYCGTQKARLLQEESGSASVEGSGSASVEGSASASAEQEAPKEKEVEWNMKRAKVTADNLAFELTLEGKAGASLDWMCVGTSLNPNADVARFETVVVTGSTSTNPPPAPPVSSASDGDSDSALMTSLFAAIIMMVAVFFY